MSRALALALVLAGCISIPDTPAPQCYSDTDCNQASGEVCGEGVCYGDPPTGTFGVSISPPASRPDLTSVERASEELPADGFLSDLTLESPVMLSGSVIAASCAVTMGAGMCPTSTLGASVTIGRPPRFAGGDGFQETAESASGATGTSFTLAVPRTRPSVDPDYTVTVVPDDLGAASSATAPAQLVPPLRTTISAGSDTQMTLALGGDELTVLTGDLVDSDGTPLTDYRVSAIGRWTGDTSDSEVSSIAYTMDGHFAIVLSAGLDAAHAVTIVAKPTGMMDVAPTLELAGVDATLSATYELAQPAALGAAQVSTLTITGTSTAGVVGPVAGARVIVTATVPSAATPMLSAVMSADVTTGSDGTAPLPLLAGTAFASGYELRVVPPAGSNLAVLDAPAFQPADGTRLLVPRVALQGTVVDATGKPVANVSVTARPALRFLWDLDDTAQVFLAQIPAATAVTGDDGDFVVFVDPSIDGIAGAYDIALEPPTGSSVPSFTLADFAIPAGTVGPMALALGNVALPVAANLHGRISDPGGVSVAGGELRVFRLPADNALCTDPTVTNPPPGCAVPAELQAHATSDSDGVVRFTLPRTP